MKRQIAKFVMIIMQFIFYFIVNKVFDVPDRIMYNTFFIYLALNLTKNMYSFKTILIWEELRKLLWVHGEYLIVMLINDLAFWGYKYIPVHLFVGLTFTFFNIFIIRFIRTIFRKNLEKSLLIIGIGNTANQITRIIKDNNTFTMYKILGYVSANNIPGVNQDVHINEKEIIGTYEELDKILEDNKVNEVLIALPLADNEQMEEIINKLDGKVDKIKFIPRFCGTFTFNSQVENYDGIMVISAKINFVRGITRIIKRVMDFMIGLLGVILLVPLTIYIYLKTDKAERKAGLFFPQERIGRDGNKIKIYKYRSMVVGADKILEEMMKNDEKIREEYEKNKKLKNDPRITKIGEFLRRTSLDEFPQFLNVLKGEMSFVGPRPYLFREKEDMGQYYEKIVKSKPGITGMWQTHGRSETDFKERLILDEYYYRNWCLWLDIVIIIKTIKNVVYRKGAY
ncbi:exopolysaccharide biosynthesis polyprenyl glycosylphosphotransferase [Fusobacterium sp.]|uniref:exopolysaccharide biosynthesis polyprenyl glycosylphosphotransferase n=1 Tax=Fusobacterium sp. TaxID=68766 RepID=UPI00261B2421|nr:exopolysaccharide biosynthesis polyprenyl glycosylphosphotransferase [Fusobacterium sp.]